MSRRDHTEPSVIPYIPLNAGRRMATRRNRKPQRFIQALGYAVLLLGMCYVLLVVLRILAA